MRSSEQTISRTFTSGREENHALNPRARSFRLNASVYGRTVAYGPFERETRSIIFPARYPPRKGSWATVETGHAPGNGESINVYNGWPSCPISNTRVSSCMIGAIIYAQQSEAVILSNALTREARSGRTKSNNSILNEKAESSSAALRIPS